VAIVISSFILILTQTTDSTHALPRHRDIRSTSTGSRKGRLSITVVREFLDKNSNPEEEIEAVERTSLSVRTTSLGTGSSSVGEPSHSREPTWFSRNGSNNFKKMKRRSRRKRQKRGAKVNTDAAYISEFKTNQRVYKYCNKLGFCLRLNADGKVDGTRNKEDPYTVLLFESHGRSIIRIKGYYANKYLTMNQKGVPAGEADPHFFDSLFRLTEEENRWDTIASYKYYFEEKFDMLVGITKDAQLKQPWKASPGQYATQFLPLPYEIKDNFVEEMRLKDQQKKSTK